MAAGPPLRPGALTLAAPRRPIRRGRPEVRHSEQGTQNGAAAYTDLLAGLGVSISMAAVGKPEEDRYKEYLIIMVESYNIDYSVYQGFDDAYAQLGRFLDDLYKRKRIHWALGCLTPRELKQQ